jgi:hypothetical protein
VCSGNQLQDDGTKLLCDALAAAASVWHRVVVVVAGLCYCIRTQSSTTAVVASPRAATSSPQPATSSASECVRILQLGQNAIRVAGASLFMCIFCSASRHQFTVLFQYETRGVVDRANDENRKNTRLSIGFFVFKSLSLSLSLCSEFITRFDFTIDCTHCRLCYYYYYYYCCSFVVDVLTLCCRPVEQVPIERIELRHNELGDDGAQFIANAVAFDSVDYFVN